MITAYKDKHLKAPNPHINKNETIVVCLPPRSPVFFFFYCVTILNISCIKLSGASLQRQGKYREAINYHSMVLELSKREGEESGNTEAYGAIADCYTELGDLEKAAKFYDQYIARLETD